MLARGRGKNTLHPAIGGLQSSSVNSEMPLISSSQPTDSGFGSRGTLRSAPNAVNCYLAIGTRRRGNNPIDKMRLRECLACLVL